MGTAATAAVLLLLYVVTVAIYRVYFSPLSHIPGPKLAALTSWYNGYHDIIRGGQYVFVVEQMHREYGPVVRVRPDAVHVSDPRFIDTLYSFSPKQRRERYWTVTNTLQAPGSMLATNDHDLHRRRRSTLNSYFSPQNIRRLQPVINSTLRNLFRRMDGWADSNTVVQMNRTLRATTKDVIQAYALGDGDRCLDMEDCNAAFFDVVVPGRVCYLGTHMYAIAVLLANTPPKIMRHLIPRIACFIDFMTDLYASVDKIRSSQGDPKGRTIFHEILRNPELPASEKETRRIGDEAMVLLIAGSETTASTLVSIIFHMLSDTEALNRLKAELDPVMADAVDSVPDSTRLEKLPYLNAVIEEAVRLYPGATHRQDRVAPDEDLMYHNLETGISIRIPAGSAVGMTAPISNRDPVVWGDGAANFDPDRFLRDPGLRRYLLSFSKGTRQCLGINLAYQELQTFTAALFHRYDRYDGTGTQARPTLEVFETTQADISMHADYVTPATYPGSQGLRLRIRHGNSQRRS